MIKISFLVFTLFLCFIFPIAAQEPAGPAPNQKLNASTSFYDLGFNEQHAALKMNYEQKPNLEIELRCFYDTYLLTNRFNNSLLFKKYCYENFYLLSGIDMELNTLKILRPDLYSPRFNLKAGIGYEVEDNWMI